MYYEIFLFTLGLYFELLFIQTWKDKDTIIIMSNLILRKEGQYKRNNDFVVRREVTN